MKQQNNTPDSAERFVPAQYILSDGTIETYSNYMVSDMGRVASLVDTHGNKRKVMKIKRPAAYSKLGHLVVGLSVRGKSYYRTVHRLVLSSFHAELWSKDNNEVDHLDRDPTHNYLDNLRWTDRNGNCANRAMNPLKKIRVTYLNDGHTEEFDNMMDCNRAFGKSVAWCSYIISNRNGFSAKYNILIEKIKHRE